MAEFDPDAYLSKGNEPPSFDPDAYLGKSKKPSVTVSEDVARVAAPSLLRGTLQALTIPGTISDLFDRGVQWTANKVAPNSSAAKFFNDMRDLMTDKKTGENLADRYSIFPSYDTAKRVVEKDTGPLPEAKTDIGKGIQTGLEVLPSLATGGPVSAAVKATAAGAGSVLGGKAGEGIKEKLPESWQPYAKPVGEVAGTLAGAMTPSGARRVVTPLPASPEFQATVDALKKQAPGMVENATAGQLTDRPWLRTMEGRRPGMQEKVANQEKEFTGAALREAGIPSKNFRDIGFGQTVGEDLGRLRRGGKINEQEFKDLNKIVQREERALTAVTDVNHKGAIEDLKKDIKFGVMQDPKNPPLNMTGKRYEELRGRIQKAIDESNGASKIALSNVREALDNAFYNSVGPVTADRVKRLANEYANYSILKNVPPGVDKTTLTPQEVVSAVGHKWGNAAANEGRGSLVPLARNASEVNKPLPPRSTEISPISDIAGSLITGAISHRLGGTGAEGAVLGHLTAPGIINATKDTTARLLASKPAQDYLKNQKWLPDRYVAPETDPRSLMIQLLMAPPGQRAVGNQ